MKKLLLLLSFILCLQVNAQLFDTPPVDLTGGTSFGSDVAISGDYIAISNSSSSQSGSPKVFIYKKDASGSWVSQQTINDFAGTRVMVAMDADNLIIGATTFDTGRAFVYKRDSSGTYVLEQELIPTTINNPPTGFFGWDVDISGNRAIVGASGPNGTDQGSIFFFEKDLSAVWSETDSFNGAFGQELGRSVSIEADNAAAGSFGGILTTYRYQSENWTINSELEVTDSPDGYSFNTDISANNAVVVGYNSSLYFFEINGGNWANRQKILAANNNAAEYGSAIGLHSDTAVVGYTNTSTSFTSYDIYTKNNAGTWVFQQTLSPIGQFSYPEFPISVAISADYLVAGVPATFTLTGKVYIYENLNTCDEVLIPDPVFEQNLVDTNIDTDGVVDGKICRADAEAATLIVMGNVNGATPNGGVDFTGLDAFINLQQFFLTGNDFDNPALPKLPMTNLDFSTMSNLVKIDIKYTLLETVDVGSNPTLIELSLVDNMINQLDLTNNSALEILRVSKNELTSLDITPNVSIREVYCDENEITNINVGVLQDFEILECQMNLLPFLDVSGNPSLRIINAGDNLLTTPMLIIDDLPSIESLNFDRNDLDDLDVTIYPALEDLTARSNNLSQMDFSMNPALEYVDVRSNFFVHLDFSNNPVLRIFDANRNQLESLNIRNGSLETVIYTRLNPNLLCIQVDDVEDPNRFFENSNPIFDDTFADWEFANSGPAWNLDLHTELSESCPPAPLNINGSLEPVYQYYRAFDMDSGFDGSSEIQDSNSTLSMSGNVRRKVHFNHTITPNTVIKFDFKISELSTLHAIGFDNDNIFDSSDFGEIFKLAGSLNAGIQQYNTYSGNDWVSFSIPVGQFFTGDFEYLTFIGHPLNANTVTQQSFFRNIVFEEVEALIVNGTGEVVTPFQEGVQNQGNHEIQDSGNTLRLFDNSWAKTPFNYTVTPNTVIEFDLKVTGEGEIHGILLEDDDALNGTDSQRLFQLAGTQTYGRQEFRTYAGNDWVSFSIPVGQFFTGDFNNIVFAADKDANGATQESFFRNIVFNEQVPDNMLNVNSILESVTSFHNGTQDKGFYEIQDANNTLKLIGNAWRKAPFNYTITPNTVIEFDLKVTGEGEIHGILLEDDDALNGTDGQRLFQLAGTQTYGRQEFRTYAGNDWVSFSIPVGQFFTGDFNNLVFAGDKDANGATQESFFRNIVFSEQVPDNMLNVNGVLEGVSSFHNGEQDKGFYEIQDANNTLKLIGNAWRKAPFNYTITPNTVIEFDLKVTGEGEIHGILLEDDDALNGTDNQRLFQLAGTQTYGRQEFRTYSGNDWISFSIPVGQFFTGDFNNLVFVADKDADGNSQESFFRNIVFNECAGCKSSALGKREISENLSVTIFPNEARESAEIKSNEIIGDANIYSINGSFIKTIRSQNLDNLKLDVAEIPNGIYFVRFTINGIQQSKKLVVRH